MADGNERPCPDRSFLRAHPCFCSRGRVAPPPPKRTCDHLTGQCCAPDPRHMESGARRQGAPHCTCSNIERCPDERHCSCPLHPHAIDAGDGPQHDVCPCLVDGLVGGHSPHQHTQSKHASTVPDSQFGIRYNRPRLYCPIGPKGYSHLMVIVWECPGAY